MAAIQWPDQTQFTIRWAFYSKVFCVFHEFYPPINLQDVRDLIHTWCAIGNAQLFKVEIFDFHISSYSRIFAGESSTDPLGSGQQTAQIGQVMTGFSTICVRAEYRTQMTITPCMVNLGCSDPNVSGSSSSQTSAQQASNWVKSDHFISAENLDNAGIVRRNVNNPDYDRYGEGNTVTTSDESSEAMRIFAASPPDNFIHRRFSDHYSSNESLGVQQRFRSSKSK